MLYPKVLIHIFSVRADAAVTTGEATTQQGHLVSWAVALRPYSKDEKQRLRVAFVVCSSERQGPFKGSNPSLIWGIASSGHTSWHEPPAGWTTQPDASWDVGHGAWGTKSGEPEEMRMGTEDVLLHRAVIDLPWRGALRRRCGIAFKWTCLSGKEALWFGHPDTGRNLFVRANFAKVVHSSSDSEGVPPSPGTGTDQLDGLLHAWQNHGVQASAQRRSCCHDHTRCSHPMHFQASACCWIQATL